jgi:hypothetical protein
LGVRTNAIGSSWCDEQGSVVYVQGKDTELVAFQLSSAQNNPTWCTVPGYRGSNPEYPASISFASVCMLDGQGIVPVFVNRFEPDQAWRWYLRYRSWIDPGPVLVSIGKDRSGSIQDRYLAN